MASLLASIALSGSQDYKVLFIACFISWLATMGGLGSAAFIYVNALSIQVDPTVDVISLPLVMMRVVLGALFAVILALPFGYQSFQKFGQNLFVPNSTVDLSEGLLLLLPFILGFSTPLVLSILNRFVQSAQTFFGVREQSEATTQGSARVSADGKRGANRDAGSARGGGCHLAHRRFDRTSVTGSSNVSGAGCECRVSTLSRLPVQVASVRFHRLSWRCGRARALAEGPQTAPRESPGSLVPGKPRQLRSEASPETCPAKGYRAQGRQCLWFGRTIIPRSGPRP
jgi:hypothetical protein